MRMQQSADILRLALRLAGTAEGLTLDEIASEFGVNRRTAERMRDAVAAVFENRLEAIPDGRTKRFRIPGGLDGFMQAPRPEELAELETAARALEAAGAGPRAALLQSLADKVKSAMRAAARRRIEPDVEALLRAEALVLQAGPRPLVDTDTLAALREALKAMRVVEFEYPYASGRVRRRKVVPFGLIFGKVYYLVGPEVGMSDPVLWRLDRMTQVRATEEPGAPPAEFDLSSFAARSFGAFQEDPEDIMLRFSPGAAPDARRFLFHPTQTTSDEPDGSLIVRFRAGGLLELVRHLFTWGDTVEILAPERLKALMIEQLQAALKRYETSSSQLPSDSVPSLTRAPHG